MSIEAELVDKTENAKTFIFFDFECTQDDLVQCEEGYIPDLYGKCVHCLKTNCGAYEHKANLCVVQKVCTGCMDKNRGSYMSAHVLLNLLNELGKRDKMRGLPSILSVFRNEFNKFNNT